MIYKIRFLIFIFLMLGPTLRALTPQEKKIIGTHAPDDEIVKKLDAIFSKFPPEINMILAGGIPQKTAGEMISLLKKSGFTVYKFFISNNPTCPNPRRMILAHKDVPDYVLKIGFDKSRPLLTISRVIVSDIVSKIVAKKKLTLFGCLEKKLYHRINMPNDINDFNYVVLSPLVSGHDLMSKRYASLFQRIIKTSDFFTLKEICNKRIDAQNWNEIILDFHRGNLLLSNKKKIYLIDTESMSEKFNPSKTFDEMLDKITQIFAAICTGGW